MSIVHSSNTTIVGQPLILTCSASVEESVSGIPMLTWSKDDIELITEYSSGSLNLSFLSLHINDSGVYICTVRLFLPEVGVDVSGVDRVSVTVSISTAVANPASPNDMKTSVTISLSSITADSDTVYPSSTVAVHAGRDEINVMKTSVTTIPPSTVIPVNDDTAIIITGGIVAAVVMIVIVAVATALTLKNVIAAKFQPNERYNFTFNY